MILGIPALLSVAHQEGFDILGIPSHAVIRESLAALCSPHAKEENSENLSPPVLRRSGRKILAARPAAVGSTLGRVSQRPHYVAFLRRCDSACVITRSPSRSAGTLDSVATHKPLLRRSDCRHLTSGSNPPITTLKQTESPAGWFHSQVRRLVPH